MSDRKLIDAEIRFQRATAERWAELNPILGIAEPGYVIGTGLVKFGDGETHWNDLAYYPPDNEPSPGDLQDHIDSDLPHPIYDDGPSLALLYENAKV